MCAALAQIKITTPIKMRSRLQSEIPLCRLCLKVTKNKIIHIFNEKVEDISNIIQLHYSIKVTASDSISTIICQRCWKQTNTFHKLYLLVQQAQDDLEDVSHEKGSCVKLQPCDGEDIQSTGFIPLQDAATDMHPLYEPQMDEKSAFSNSSNKEAITLNAPVDVLTPIADNSAIPVYKDVLVQPNNRKRKRKPIKQTQAVKEQHSDSGEQSADDKERFINEVCSEDDPNDMKKQKHQSRFENRLKFNITNEELIKKHISFVCELCSFVGGNFIELTEHFEEVHEDHNRGAYVRCCGKRLSKRYDIVQHAYKHEDPEYFKCTECNKILSDRNTLKNHYATTHGPKENLKYGCDQCDKKFSRPSHLELHKSYHVPVQERKFTCTQCPAVKMFASHHLLQVHKNVSHNRSPNVCHVCAKVIRDKKCFEKHVRAHLGQLGPRVKCPLAGCDSWLQDDDGLKHHLRQHDAVKTYACTECDRVCKSLRLLRSHTRYTHDKSTYSCSECNKSFKRALTLKEHMAQHSGDKLYKCTFCTRTFYSNANMYAHRKKMHPKEWDQSRKANRGNQQQYESSSAMSIVNTLGIAQESLPCS